jgi:hypothetical protein
LIRSALASVTNDGERSAGSILECLLVVLCPSTVWTSSMWAEMFEHSECPLEQAIGVCMNQDQIQLPRTLDFDLHDGSPPSNRLSADSTLK